MVQYFGSQSLQSGEHDISRSTFIHDTLMNDDIIDCDEDLGCDI